MPLARNSFLCPKQQAGILSYSPGRRLGLFSHTEGVGTRGAGKSWPGGVAVRIPPPNSRHFLDLPYFCHLLIIHSGVLYPGPTHTFTFPGAPYTTKSRTSSTLPFVINLPSLTRSDLQSLSAAPCRIPSSNPNRSPSSSAALTLTSTLYLPNILTP
jgi:hypothetical protein